MDEAWSQLIGLIKKDPVKAESIKRIFKVTNLSRSYYRPPFPQPPLHHHDDQTLDADDSGGIDIDELLEGLKKLRLKLSHDHVAAFRFRPLTQSFMDSTIELMGSSR